MAADMIYQHGTYRCVDIRRYFHSPYDPACVWNEAGKIFGSKGGINLHFTELSKTEKREYSVKISVSLFYYFLTCCSCFAVTLSILKYTFCSIICVVEKTFSSKKGNVGISEFLIPHCKGAIVRYSLS